MLLYLKAFSLFLAVYGTINIVTSQEEKSRLSYFLALALYQLPLLYFLFTV